MSYETPGLFDLVLREQHRAATLAELAIRGFQFDHCDAGAIDAAAAEATQQMAKEQSTEIDWDIVEYDGGHPSPGMHVLKPIYPVSILGSRGISLASQRAQIYTPGATASEYTDAPVRSVDINLHGGKSSGTARVRLGDRERAAIILAPDTPPAAIHYCDIHYTWEREGGDTYDNPRMISRVQAYLGAEAVEFLSGHTISSLLSAINSAKATIGKSKIR